MKARTEQFNHVTITMIGSSSVMAAQRDLIFDVTVIGAGIEGSSTAYQLSKMGSGKKIALVEQVSIWCTRVETIP